MYTQWLNFLFFRWWSKFSNLTDWLTDWLYVHMASFVICLLPNLWLATSFMLCSVACSGVHDTVPLNLHTFVQMLHCLDGVYNLNTSNIYQTKKLLGRQVNIVHIQPHGWAQVVIDPNVLPNIQVHWISFALLL